MRKKKPRADWCGRCAANAAVLFFRPVLRFFCFGGSVVNADGRHVYAEENASQSAADDYDKTHYHRDGVVYGRIQGEKNVHERAQKAGNYVYILTKDNGNTVRQNVPENAAAAPGNTADNGQHQHAESALFHGEIYAHQHKRRQSHGVHYVESGVKALGFHFGFKRLKGRHGYHQQRRAAGGYYQIYEIEVVDEEFGGNVADDEIAQHSAAESSDICENDGAQYVHFVFHGHHGAGKREGDYAYYFKYDSVHERVIFC